MVGGPELIRIARTVDIRLAERRRDADRKLLERAAVAAHRVPLEVREHEHRIVIFNILADVIFPDHRAVRNRQLKVRPLGVENINRKIAAPAVLLHRFFVFFGRVALALIGRVAFDDRSAESSNILSINSSFPFLFKDEKK